MYSLWFDVILWRGVTAAWVPFFDDMDAIIFLAPISCFDQVLEEDENVNRLVRRSPFHNTVASQSLNILAYAGGFGFALEDGGGEPAAEQDEFDIVLE